MPKNRYHGLPFVTAISNSGSHNLYVVTDLMDEIDEQLISQCGNVFLCCDLSRYDAAVYASSKWHEILSEKALYTPFGRNVEQLARVCGSDIKVELINVPLARVSVPQKTGALEFSKIFKSMDSRERTFDGNKLMPSTEIKSGDAQTQKIEQLLRRDSRPRGKSLRYRAGATKRHLLSCLRDIIYDYSPPEPVSEEISGSEQQAYITLTGITYTFVTDRLDEESGWNDLVSAFCAAFKNNNEVNLIVYLRGDLRECCAADFNHVLHTLGPISCNVFLLQGNISESEYFQLIAETMFFVGTSRRYALQADLIAFACAGKPTLSLPNCLDSAVNSHLITLPIGFTKELSYPDRSHIIKYTTHAFRMNWESLFDRFKSSFLLAQDQPSYAELCQVHRGRVNKLLSGEEAALKTPLSFVWPQKVTGL